MSVAWTRDEENGCIERAKAGDARAWARLLAFYDPILSYAARAATRRGGASEDYMQQARMGLMHAVSKYRPEHGTRFWTYARWWVRAHVNSYSWANCRIVPLPQSRVARRVFGRLQRIEMQLGEHASDERIAAAIDVDAEELAYLRASMKPDVSYDGIGHGLDDLACVAPSADDELDAARDDQFQKRALATALRELPEREGHIIQRRYLQDPPEPLAAVGARLGLSRERVRQLEARALTTLRRAILDADAAAPPSELAVA